MELGNYDQCIETRKELEPNNTFQGQYCMSLVTLQVNNSNLPEGVGKLSSHQQPINPGPVNVRFLPSPAAR